MNCDHPLHLQYFLMFLPVCSHLYYIQYCVILLIIIFFYIVSLTTKILSPPVYNHPVFHTFLRVLLSCCFLCQGFLHVCPILFIVWCKERLNYHVNYILLACLISIKLYSEVLRARVFSSTLDNDSMFHAFQGKRCNIGEYTGWSQFIILFWWLITFFLN